MLFLIFTKYCMKLLVVVEYNNKNDQMSKATSILSYCRVWLLLCFHHDHVFWKTSTGGKCGHWKKKVESAAINKKPTWL